MPWKEKVIVTMREEFVKRVLSHYTACPSRNIIVNHKFYVDYNMQPEKILRMVLPLLICYQSPPSAVPL